MEVFVKSFTTYRTIKKVKAVSWSLVLDSLEKESSSVTVAGTEVGRSDTGNWLIFDNLVFLITGVKPQTGQAVLTLASPLQVFSRSLELAEQQDGQTIGGFILAEINAHWVQEEDPIYAMPYLVVSNSDTTPYISPELGNNACFVLSDYCRLVRRGYRVTLSFLNSGSKLVCAINKSPSASRQISFQDGKSQLQNVDYSFSGTSKLTVLCDVASGDTVTRQRSVWYLSESGEISQEIPARRAPGEWATILVKNPDEIESKVVETFAKNKANHKLEFWSTMDMAVHDNCTFFVYGDLLQSYISYKRQSSGDKRFYYKSGELATTATEKLRGVNK